LEGAIAAPGIDSGYGAGQVFRQVNLALVHLIGMPQRKRRWQAGDLLEIRV